MKTLTKLLINRDRLIDKKELETLRGGYDVNYCAEGIDRWTCSIIDECCNSFYASFCVPGGADPPGARDYVASSFPQYTVNACW